MMNIALITDENYVTPTGTAIASVLESNPGEQFAFYIVTKFLSQSHVSALESFVAPHKERARLKIIAIDDADLVDFPLRAGDHVSAAAYYRIFFPSLFDDSLSKILYLDGDILCVDSLRSFYDTDLEEYSCAVTHDERNDAAENFTRLKYPQENGYFCSGVMLINLDWWRKNAVMQKCLDYIASEPDACLWHDQDALNHVLNGTVLWASFRYNFMQGYFFDKKSLVLDSRFYPEVDAARKNPCILHFSSAYKPWHYECNHPLKEYYRDFFKRLTGKRLPLAYRLRGKKHLVWLLKRLLDLLRIRHFADFRKPVQELALRVAKYQLYERTPNQKIAGGKAPQDVRFFAEQFGFRTVYFFHWGERTFFRRITGQVRRFFEYLLFFIRVKPRSVLFLQFPYIRGGILWRHFFYVLAKRAKSLKVVTIIHDINELRYEHAETEARLFDFAIRFSDVLITHNGNMSDYLINVRKVPAEKLVPLGLFDYHFPASSVKKEIVFEKSISIAGNLDRNKCLYLQHLPLLKDCAFHLYGLNYTDYDCKSIVYHGAFQPEDIISELNHGFGLVWDGDSIDSCKGVYGRYLQFNNPHKLSMYISASLPVIVWEKSALRDFVVSNGLGFAVSDLHEAVSRVNGTTEAEYKSMSENCGRLSERLRTGFFLKRAIGECFEVLYPPPGIYTA